MRRLLRSIVLVSIASMALGCASSRSIPIPHEVDSGPELAQLSKGIEVTGFTTRDGVRYSFEATVELQDNGSWRIRPHGYGQAPYTLAGGEVVELEVSESTGIGKFVAGSLMIGMLGVLVLGLIFASWEGTP